MTVVAVFEGAENLSVEPGQATTCRMSIANTGSIVEQFTLLPMGEGAEWIQADPAVVSLFPGAQQTVQIRFAPPRLHSTPAGPVPFAIKVIPSNQPEESVTEEGTVNVGTFRDFAAELVPKVATGRLAGRQKLAIDSRGNEPVPVDVVAIDPADALKFRLSPSKLTAAPGAAHFVKVRIKPRRRHWRGPDQQKPYKVQVFPEGESPLLLDGGLTQKAVLPKWFIGLLAAIAALLLLWFLVLRPVVHNEAVSANKAALAAQQQQTKALASQVSAAQNAAQASQAAVAALAGKQPPPTTTTTTTVPKKAAPTTTTTATTVAPVPVVTVVPLVTNPSDGEMEVHAAPGSSATGSDANFPLAPSSTLKITDIVLENVSGSIGTARVQRVDPQTGIQDLLVQNLATLNDQEYQFNTPIVFNPGDTLQVQVNCTGNQTACDVSLYYSGSLTHPQ